MGWIPGVPTADANIHGYRTCRPMVVCHRTYGGWGGDYSVIQSGGLAQLLIGKYEGQWVQFGPTEARMYHCNGANDGYGIEMTGVNEDEFTDWQLRCLRYVLPQLRTLIGVPLEYSDGSDGWVNGHTYVGFHAHNHILTDDGTSQHSNLWLMSDWRKVVQAAPTPDVKRGKKMRYIKCSKLPTQAERDVIYLTDDLSKRRVTPDEFKWVSAIGGTPSVFDVPTVEWFNSIPVLARVG